MPSENFFSSSTSVPLESEIDWVDLFVKGEEQCDLSEAFSTVYCIHSKNSCISQAFQNTNGSSMLQSALTL